jgi:uncharacterized protein YbjT (DUF2867 family)
MNTDLNNAKNFNKIVTIFGGSGFVGNAVVKELSRNHYIVNIVSRDEEKASKIKTYSTPGKINIIKADIKNEKEIGDAIKGSDFVINLVATFDDSKIHDFQYIHAQFPEKIAKFCMMHSVEKLIQMSNLGIENGFSIFAKTRFLGETAVLAGFKNSIILRSSVIVGEEDSFLRIFIILAHKFRFLPLISNSKNQIEVQPVYVENVAQAIIWLLENQLNQNLYKIAGPEIFSFKQICEKIKENMPNKIFIAPMNIKLLKILAKIMNFKIFSPINSFIFGTSKSGLSSEKIEAINFNGKIEKNDQNLLFKIGAKAIFLNEVIKKVKKFLFDL